MKHGFGDNAKFSKTLELFEVNMLKTKKFCKFLFMVRIRTGWITNHFKKPAFYIKRVPNFQPFNHEKYIIFHPLTKLVNEIPAL